MNLIDKNVLITGSARRLGRAMAKGFAAKGANIAIHYNRSKEEAISLKEEIEKDGAQVLLVKGDIASEKKIGKIVQDVASEFGSIDILINNASIFPKNDINEVKNSDWDEVLAINLKAPFYFAREFVSLPSTGIRKIINMADGYGCSPAKGFVPYGVSKAGLIALTKGLAKEYGPDVLVNSICPGPILPPEEVDIKFHDRVVAKTILKKEGGAEPIVHAAIFLAENDYITGHEIFIDGGRFV